MTYYYIEKDNKIKLYDTDKEKLITTQSIMPDLEGLEIQETSRPIEEFQFADTEEYKAKKAAEETNKINSLTMTALDFINVLKQAGFTLEDRKAYFAANPEIEEQLTFCQNVYCGVVRQLCPIEVKGKTLTEEEVIEAFKVKNNIQ